MKRKYQKILKEARKCFPNCQSYEESISDCMDINNHFTEEEHYQLLKECTREIIIETEEMKIARYERNEIRRRVNKLLTPKEEPKEEPMEEWWDRINKK